MANEIDIDLGSFDLSSANDIAIEAINIKVAKKISSTSLPKTDGSVIPIARRSNITVKIKGTVIGTNYDDLRSNLDSIKSSIESTAEQKLTLDDDRYLNVQYRGFSYSYKTLRTFANFSFDLIASDPFWLSETLSEDDRTPTSGAGYSVSNGGNAPTRCKITLTNNSGGDITNAIQFENSTTGELFKFIGTLADTKSLIINNRVDTRDLVVTNDGTDEIQYFEGDFITLDPGSNTLEYTGTANVQVVTEYRDAHY